MKAITKYPALTSLFPRDAPLRELVGCVAGQDVTFSEKFIFNRKPPTMQKLLCALIFVIVLPNLLAAQNINHVSYKIITTSSQIKSVQPGLAKECDITINGDLFTMHKREYNGGKLLTESQLIFDLKKGLRELQYNDNAYNVDSIDALYTTNTELIATGETKTIKGLKCEKYTLKKKKGEPASFILDMIIPKYTFWVTKDIQFDKRFNKAVVSALTKFLSAEFEGALVQIDYQITNPKQEVPSDISIDVRETVKVDDAQFEMRYKSGDKYKAVVQDPAPGNVFGGGSTTSEDLQERFRRQKKLLAEILGQENPKYLVRNLGD